MNELIKPRNIINILLMIANTMLWYSIINPSYITHRIILLTGLYLLSGSLIGIKPSLKVYQGIAAFMIGYDFLEKLLGNYSYILIGVLILYMVYKVTINKQMVEARDNLAKAIKEAKK